MKLKKGDIIKLIDNQPVHSKKHIYQMLSRFSKKQKTFSLLVTRNKKDFLISYKIVPFKTKKRFLISDVSKVKDKESVKRKAGGQRQTASVKKKKNGQRQTVPKKKDNKEIRAAQQKENSKAKQALVPEKYKSHLQRAYVTALNSFIYEQPDFDAKQLYPLPTGEKILISKKIFRPPHNFGSFHKILLFRPKKIVGYISEAEVAPEFIKQADKYKINPAYKLAQKQMKEDKALDLSLFEKKANNEQEEKQESPSKNNKKRYAGVSLGFSSFSPSEKDILVGLKLSGYHLLISSLNMDYNLAFSPYDRKFFHFDILAAYPLIKANPYFLYLLGGMKFDVNHRIKDLTRQNDLGVSGALSLMIPLNQKLLLRLDAKAEYGLSTKSFLPIMLGSVQIAF